MSSHEIRRASPLRALVVGAGIAGPVVGMWLRRLGLDVVVAEGRAGVAPTQGAFLGVAPNGMHVLDALGLAHQVAAEGHACESFAFIDARGRTLGTIDRSHDRRAFGWPLTMVRRGRLHERLVDAAEARGVAFRFGRRLVTIDRSGGDRVVASFSDGSEIVADVLLGCDGVGSTVRAAVLPGAPSPRSCGLLDYGGFAAVPTPFTAGVNGMVFGRRAFFGAFTTPRGETWWFHNGPPPASDDRRTGRARLLDLHRDDPPWIGDVIEATAEILGPWPLHELDSIPRWSEGRVCLLGDAAHAMPPSAGQGASLAMEDAMVLARLLRDTADPVAAFVAFEHERRPRVEAIARQARRHGGGKAAPGPVAAWVRDRMLGLFLPLAGQAQSRAYGHRIEWEPAA